MLRHRRLSKILKRAACLAAPWVLAGQVQAEDLFPRTSLVSISDESDLSKFVRNAGSVDVTRSDGSSMDIGGWYRSDWRDLSLTWITQISSKMGVYWGFGTGEQGEKYRIDPSLRLGFIYSQPVAKNASVTLSTMYIVGGSLSENTCQADYGPIFGSYTVNCRLASSTLRPGETLDYMLDRDRPNRFRVSLRYKMDF